jgi:hypothetical protein
VQSKKIQVPEIESETWKYDDEVRNTKLEVFSLPTLPGNFPLSTFLSPLPTLPEIESETWKYDIEVRS